jgi:hypothetical protein
MAARRNYPVSAPMVALEIFDIRQFHVISPVRWASFQGLSAQRAALMHVVDPWLTVEREQCAIQCVWAASLQQLHQHHGLASRLNTDNGARTICAAIHLYVLARAARISVFKNLCDLGRCQLRRQ